jgi:hypothetical protein
LKRLWSSRRLRAYSTADAPRLRKARDYYLNRLRDVDGKVDLRGLVAELCAEGAPNEWLQDDGIRVLRDLIDRDWRECRDTALMTFAAVR